MYTQKAKRVVLGEGETIGHKHVLESTVNISYEKMEGDVGLPFFLKQMGILTHDEHDRIVLQPGKYRSYNQVEFNPMDSTVNRVFD